MRSPTHEHNQRPDSERSQRRALETSPEELGRVGATDPASLERMQRSAGNAAVGAMLVDKPAPQAKARSQAKPVQRAPGAGAKARATGRRAAAAVGAKLGRLAGGRSRPASPSFDAVMRAVAAPAETAAPL